MEKGVENIITKWKNGRCTVLSCGDCVCLNVSTFRFEKGPRIPRRENAEILKCKNLNIWLKKVENVNNKL